MKLIVGLGNPGEKYAKTRHNLGFMIVDQFLKDFEPQKDTVWNDSKKFKSDIAQIEWHRRSAGSSSSLRASSGQAIMEKVILVKPKTYMNNSGMAVSLISKFYKIKPEDIWIVHDDIDFQVGNLKIRFGGGDAGHNGVASVTKSLGTDKFWRVRLGIEFGEKIVVEDFVLRNFSPKEKGKVKKVIKNASDALQEVLENGTDVAMNKFNTR